MSHLVNNTYDRNEDDGKENDTLLVRTYNDDIDFINIENDDNGISLNDFVQKITTTTDPSVFLEDNLTTDNNVNKNLIAKSLVQYIGKDSISYNKSEVKNINNNIKSCSDQIDFDSLIIIFHDLNSKFMNIHKIDIFKNCMQDTDDDKKFSMIATNIVSLSKKFDWISASEMNIIIPLDYTKYKSVRATSTKLPTIGFARNRDSMFLLPPPRHATEPMYAWISLKQKEVYHKCVLHIAIQILKCYNTSTEVEMTAIFQESLKHSRTTSSKKNSGSIGGGFWVYRLAYIMYKMTLVKEECTMYIEETYGMKARTMNAKFETDFNLFDKAKSNKIFESEINNISNKLAQQISEKCKASYAYALLRFYLMDIMISNINISIGLQTEAHLTENGTKVPLWPGQKQSLKEEKKKNINKNDMECVVDDDSLKQYYSNKNYFCFHGFQGTGGHTERFNYSQELMSEQHEAIENSQRKGKLPSNISEYIKVFKARDDNQCFAVRTQLYYNTIRYSYGGKLCGKDQINNNIIGDKLRIIVDVSKGIEFLYDTEGNHIINQLYSKSAALSEYKTRIKLDLKTMNERSGFRQETCYTSNGCNVNCTNNVWQHLNSVRESKMNTNLQKLFKDPVCNSVHMARDKITFVKCTDYVMYAYLTIYIYMYMYTVCLHLLQQTMNEDERISLCIYLKLIQDSLALVYTGDIKPQEINRPLENKENEMKRFYTYSILAKRIANQLNRSYSLLLDPPRIVRSYLYNELKQQTNIVSNVLGNSGMMLVPIKNNHSAQAQTIRGTSYTELKKYGHKKLDSKYIWKCANDSCIRKYFLTRDSLDLHLNDNKNNNCKKFYRKESKENYKCQCTEDIFNSLSDEIENHCSKSSLAHSYALDSIRKGYNVFITGDCGAGKSELAKLLMKQCVLIYDDWGTTQSKVLGVAAMRLACKNMSPYNFETIHGLCGVNIPVIPYYQDQEELINTCRDKLDKDLNLKTKLRCIEVLVIDEVGVIKSYEGIFMLTLIRVAKGYYGDIGDKKSVDKNDVNNSNMNSKSKSKSKSKSNFDEIKMTREKRDASKDVQLIVVGQAAQTLPIIDQKDSQNYGTTKEEWDKSYENDVKNICWALNSDLLNMCIPIYLTTAFRFEEDIEFKEVMERAKTGDVTENDYKYICSDKCGSKAKQMVFSKSIVERSQVTFLVFTNKDRYQSNNIFLKMVEKVLKEKEIVNRGITMVTSYSKNIIVEDTIQKNQSKDQNSNKKIKTNDDNGNCTDEADDSNIQNEEKTLNKDIEMTEQNATRDVVMEVIEDGFNYTHEVLIVKFNYNGKQKLNNLDNEDKKTLFNKRNPTGILVPTEEKDIHWDNFCDRMMDDMNHSLRMYVGMPIKILSNMSVKVVNKEILGSKRARSEELYEVCNGQSARISQILLKEGTEEPEKVYIRVNVGKDLPEKELCIVKKYSLDKQVKLKLKNYLNSFTYIKIKRLQFPFTYAMCVSWSTVQGLTIPYIFVNLKQFDNNNNQYPYNIGSKNNIMYKNIAKIGMASTQSYQMPNDALEPGHNKHANWFVTLGRVRSSKNIWLHAPLVDSKFRVENNDAQLVLKNYMRCIFKPALNSEAKFKESSLLLQQLFQATLVANKDDIDNPDPPPLYELKAVHPIVLMDNIHQKSLQAQFIVNNKTQNDRIREKEIEQGIVKISNIIKWIYHSEFYYMNRKCQDRIYNDGHAIIEKVQALIQTNGYTTYIAEVIPTLKSLEQRFLEASNNKQDHLVNLYIIHTSPI